MSLSVVFLAVTCSIAMGVTLAVPSGFARSPARKSLAVSKKLPTLRSQEACCGEYGCFNSGGAFFDLLNRPINSVPNCGLTDKLKIHLNTRANPIATQIVTAYDTSTIVASNFDATKKTVFIIHGFLDNFQWPWWKETVKEMLQDGDYNVFRLDWSHGNTLPYLQAAANIRLVGAFSARFLLHLKSQYGADPANMHVVGHSLGAHGAGYMGTLMKKANATLARITGLDPAGPYFTSLAPEVRLDPNDATFVDTIITDGESIFNLGFGSDQAMGHVNFYPNGGLNQPGCESGILSTIFHGPTMNSTSFDLLGTVAATAFESVACNHARAPVLFHESINNKPCAMKAFECADYAKFIKPREEPPNPTEPCGHRFRSIKRYPTLPGTKQIDFNQDFVTDKEGLKGYFQMRHDCVVQECRKSLPCGNANRRRRNPFNLTYFLRGECFRCAEGKCAELGWHVDPALAQKYRTKKFFTMTTEKSPFCTSPHKLEITLAAKTSSNNAKTKLGFVYVTLIGTLATSEKRLLTPTAIELVPGQTYTFFFETRKELGQVQSVIFYWDNQINLLNPLDWVRTHYIHLEGNMVLTEAHELVSIFQPARNKVEEKKDLHAPLVNSFQQ